MFNSLRRQLLAVWILVGIAGLSVAWLMFAIYRQTTSVRADQAVQVLSAVCQRISARIQASSPHQPSSDPALLDIVLQLVLGQAEGVEGGVWDHTAGEVAYSYPTYDGVEPKTDVPAAERTYIEGAAGKAIAQRAAVTAERHSARETVLLTACPIDGARATWVMTRVRSSVQSDRRLLIGASLLLLMVVASAVGLGGIVRRWTRSLLQLQQFLSHADESEIPTLPPVGYTELDQLSSSVMGYAHRMVEARHQASDLTAELARAQRLTALGRLTAAVAHEIRNPIATMRLTAENAIAATVPGDLAPLQTMLQQIHRLNGLVESLLSMAQPVQLRYESTSLQPWITDIAAGLRAQFPQVDRVVSLEALSPGEWVFDRVHLGRALENLLKNALQHSAYHAPIQVATSVVDASLRIEVCNAGAGVAPEIRAHLFEPFASGRTGGTGLGLAQAREVVLAHGGDLTYHQRDHSTCFVIEVPWRAS